MRLIDADEAVKIIKKYDDRGLTLDEVTRITDGIAKEIEAMPTVDAVEVVRCGEWQPMNERNEIYGDVYMCDNYGHGFVICENFHYCPNCGAKMDGD